MVLLYHKEDVIRGRASAFAEGKVRNAHSVGEHKHTVEDAAKKCR